MVEQKVLEDVKARLVQAYDPLEIYLVDPQPDAPFNEETPFEIGVVVPEIKGSGHLFIAKGHEALWGVYISKDIFVYDRSRFETLKNEPTSLAYHFAHAGTKIYAKHAV